MTISYCVQGKEIFSIYFSLMVRYLGGVGKLFIASVCGAVQYFSHINKHTLMTTTQDRIFSIVIPGYDTVPASMKDGKAEIADAAYTLSDKFGGEFHASFMGAVLGAVEKGQTSGEEKGLKWFLSFDMDAPEFEQRVNEYVKRLPVEQVKKELSLILGEAPEQSREELNALLADYISEGHEPEIPVLGTPKQPIEDLSWEYLNVYEFRVYPDVLLVTTTANVEQFRKAIETFGEIQYKGEGANIEQVLRDAGFPAVAVSKPEGIQVFNL